MLNYIQPNKKENREIEKRHSQHHQHIFHFCGCLFAFVGRTNVLRFGSGMINQEVKVRRRNYVGEKTSPRFAGICVCVYY